MFFWAVTRFAYEMSHSSLSVMRYRDEIACFMAMFFFDGVM
jgi:hypothetical protein